MRRIFFQLIATLGVLVSGLAAASGVVAETKVATTVESRIVLAFKADDSAVQEMMPEGWRLLTLPKGPLAGTNLIVSLIDRQLVLDAEGKPASPPTGKAVALLAYGVKAGVEGATTFVLGVYETPPVASDYGNGVSADFTRELSVKDTGMGAVQRTETWAMSAVDGNSLTVGLNYQHGPAGWSSSQAKPHSASDPGFYRIYKYEQLVELAMSTAIKRDLNGTLNVSAGGDDLGALLDGSETLTGILVVPVYKRDVYLP